MPAFNIHHYTDEGGRHLGQANPLLISKFQVGQNMTRPFHFKIVFQPNFQVIGHWGNQEAFDQKEKNLPREKRNNSELKRVETTPFAFKIATSFFSSASTFGSRTKSEEEEEEVEEVNAEDVFPQKIWLCCS